MTHPHKLFIVVDVDGEVPKEVLVDFRTDGGGFGVSSVQANADGTVDGKVFLQGSKHVLIGFEACGVLVAIERMQIVVGYHSR